jgi:hypothetical protein
VTEALRTREIQAQEVAAFIGHTFILTAVVLTIVGRLAFTALPVLKSTTSRPKGRVY